MSGTRVSVVLGAGSFGTPESGARLNDPAIVQRFIDLCVVHGQCGIDASRIYGNGTSEKLLGTLDLRDFMRIDTKNFPSNPGDHAPDGLKQALQESREALGPHNIRVFYLHAPDKAVPFEQTLAAVDELHKSGYFEEWGVCNFSVSEMQEILVICKEHGYIQPTVFQGAYNLIDRAFETAIIPLLRQHRIRLAAHSPLAGGYLTGKMLPRSQQSSPSEILSHFDPSWGPSSYYTKRYLPMAPALAELQAFVAERGLTLREVAYRWLQYHSAMAPEDHGLVVGASSLEQLESTILDCKKGPLPDTVVRACNETWEKVKEFSKDSWEP
ncbi:uncharacterized protein PHACADRAFT_154194 [Phanerochaete carnosa HHB-10118-sp]|uniref:NADP-dependent oxidoreductase domain-containing protein n=1 Tax=Phanerochaete carnosa (strain HHB-10118-sp) TaxID=650164 RepID=K5VEU5_PHACS|nr:uncharacterized protein PHACADRAFT_154194 [Phanerochaete carnosa HHB-10118-sp]EKM49688.1 hypothetical protein PHACADRAFT_154194 [Phanerochaete carnosa HHB-10118-sp]